MMSRTREAAVWQQVLAASEEAPAPKPAAGGFTPAQVMDLLEDELQDANTYLALARRARREIRQSLLQLSQEEQQHARRLETVYFLMTGRRPEPKRPAMPDVGNVMDALRTRYQGEVAGAAQYRRLAEQADSFGPVLQELGSDEARHAQTVLRLLQRSL